MVYDFPPGWTGSKALKGWKGQKQVWFAYRFTGEDAEVNLDLHETPEFDGWRWAQLDEAPEQVIPFKRATYDHVVRAFARYAEPSDSSPTSCGVMGDLLR